MLWASFTSLFSTLGLALARQVALKTIKVKLHLLTNIDMLAMVEKVIRGGKCHPIYQ